MSYDDLRSYLVKLRDERSAPNVTWDVVDPALLRAVNHDQLAGLQLADAVASGVFYAVHRTPYGEVEDRYLRLLSRTVYRREGRLEGYGLKLWCNDAAEVARVIRAASGDADA